MDKNSNGGPKPQSPAERQIARLQVVIEQMQRVIEDTVRGHEAAMSAYTIALSRVVDASALERALNMQVISAERENSTAADVRDRLLQAAWRPLADAIGQ